jgi:hypothetical protein
LGGAHFLTPDPAGVGKFSVADFDRFELDSFGRVPGANLPSVAVMVEMALATNSDLDIRRFAEGVNTGNVERLLDDANL